MKRKHLLGNRIFMALVFVFLYAPIFILIIFSFNAGNSSAVWKGFSLMWYAKLFQNRIIMQSVYTTLLVSLLATVIATVAGTFASIGFHAMRRRARDPLMMVNSIPMMNADIVTGVSLCLLFVAFFNGWGTFAGWVNSWQSLVVLPERLTMGFGTLLLAGSFFAAFIYTMMSDSFSPVLYGLFVLVGMAWAAINVNSLPMVVEICSGNEVGKFTGLYYTFSMSAQIMTPIVAGWLLEHVDYKTLFLYAAIFVFASFVTMGFVKHGDNKVEAKKGLDAFDVDN